MSEIRLNSYGDESKLEEAIDRIESAIRGLQDAMQLRAELGHVTCQAMAVIVETLDERVTELREKAGLDKSKEDPDRGS